MVGETVEGSGQVASARKCERRKEQREGNRRSRNEDGKGCGGVGDKYIKVAADTAY